MNNNTISDWKLGLIGFTLGLVILGGVMISLHKDPFDSLFLFLLPGLPALVLTLIRPHRVWKWWLSSSMVLPLLIGSWILINQINDKISVTHLFIKAMGICFLLSMSDSLIGVVLGYSIAKLIHLMRRKVLSHNQ